MLREPKEASEPRDETKKSAPAPGSDTSSERAGSARLGSRDGASGVAAASGGESDSVAPSLGDDADAATVEIEAGVVGHRGDAAPAPANAPPASSAGEPHDELPGDDGFGGGFDGYDDDDGFGGGFEDDGDFGGDGVGATPAHGAVGFGRMVDGGNDPMTGGLDGFGKRKRPARLGPRRPAGTPHKLERARMAKRQSLALAGAGSRHDLEDENGKPIRRSNRTRTRPLQYWRGETKTYTRVHESLPTVAQMTHRTPNPAWPKHTPWHGGGAVIAVGASVNADSAERARRAGEEARRRARGWRTSRTSRTRARTRTSPRSSRPRRAPPRRSTLLASPRSEAWWENETSSSSSSVLEVRANIITRERECVTGGCDVRM